MSRLIEFICSNPLLLKLQKEYISIFRFGLKRAKYNVGLEDGTNNLLLNFVDFVFLIVYCVLSGYNVYKTFDLSKPPSYLVFTLNMLNLSRYYIANKIKIRDVKNVYLKKNVGQHIENLNVESTKVRTIIECMSLSVSMFFTIIGRLWGIDLFGIRSVSRVAIVSVVIVIFTGIEGIISIAVNMFKAEPKIYVESKKEGDEGC